MTLSASVVLRAQGEAARWVRNSSISESVALLEKSVAAARSAGRHDLVREAQLTLAGSQYLKGNAELALSTLDSAAAGADGHLAAKVLFQRATIMAREGQPERALGACWTLLSPSSRSTATHDSRRSRSAIAAWFSWSADFRRLLPRILKPLNGNFADSVFVPTWPGRNTTSGAPQDCAMTSSPRAAPIRDQ